VHGQQSII